MHDLSSENEKKIASQTQLIFYSNLKFQKNKFQQKVKYFQNRSYELSMKCRFYNYKKNNNFKETYINYPLVQMHFP